MSKYWGYARVSTEEQSDYSIAHQLAYLEYKAKEVNMEFLPKSEKQSGSDLKKRKMLQLILEKSQRGDIVGFYDSSRLGRNTQDSLQIIDKLTRKGVLVQIGGKTFDESSPRDELLFTIEAAISSFYRKEQNLKSHVGIELSKKNGNWIFTGNLLGYDVKMIRNKKIIEINEEEAEIIKFIFTTYAKGESINKTTKLLNERGFRTKRGFRFNAASVRRTIHKPIYMGYYKLEGSNRKGQDTLPLEGSTLVKSNYYKPIIDEDLWYKVQKSYRTLKRAHARQFEYRYAHYELSSILKCYYCKEMGKATGYAHSYHKATRSRKANSNYINRVHLPGCKQTWQTFRAEVIEAVFRVCFHLVFAYEEELNSFIEAQKNVLDLKNEEIYKDIERIESRIADIEKKEKNLINAIEEYGLSDDTIVVRLNELKKEKNQLNQERDIQTIGLAKSEDEYLLLRQQFSEQTLLSFCMTDQPASRRSFYIKMLESAYVKDNKVLIRYINGKEFVVNLIRNRGRIIQTDFDVDVFFKGKEQYTVRIYSNTETFSLLSVKSHIKKHVKNADVFIQASKKRVEIMLAELAERVKEYKKDKGKYNSN